MTVKRILSGKGSAVVTIDPTATVAAAASLLAERRIGALVATGADHQVIGIISERDIVRELGRRGSAILNGRVAELMSREVVTCSPTMTIPAIMALITEHRVRHIPVLEQDRLAGIVSIGDVVKARLEEIERESEDLREYIRTA